jgi:hypothetical protein
MADKNTTYDLVSLTFTWPNGTTATVNNFALFQQSIKEQGNWTIYLADIPEVFLGLKVAMKLVFNVSKCNGIFEEGAFCTTVVANRPFGGLPSLTMQPFYCIGHEFRVNDIVHLFIQNWRQEYPKMEFNQISIFVEHGKCGSCMITNLDSFNFNSQNSLAPYGVIDWVVPAKFKHSIVRLVLQYTVTVNYPDLFPNPFTASFVERSVIPIHIE